MREWMPWCAQVVPAEISSSSTVDISIEHDTRGAAAEEGRGAVAAEEPFRGPDEADRPALMPTSHAGTSGVAAVISTERRCADSSTK